MTEKFKIGKDVWLSDGNGSDRIEILLSVGLIMDAYKPIPPETDDTGAFQRILNDSVAKGYIPIYLTRNITISNTVTTPQDFKQPLIFGRGYLNTRINYTGIASGKSALKFKGGSGTLSGGGIYFVGFEGNTNSIGVELADCCGVDVYCCQFGTNKTGVLFHNEATGGFTEYCVVKDSNFIDTCARALEYKITSGNGSFHGSGMDGCKINQSATETEPKVLIASGCIPYNSPLSFQIWTRSSTPIIRHLGNSQSYFHGHITVENFGAGTVEVVDSTSVLLPIVGGMSGWNERIKSGLAVFCDRVQANTGGSLNIQRKQYNIKKKMAAGDNSLVTLDANESVIVSVLFFAPNYEYHFTGIAYKNPTDNNGVFTQLANERSFNTAAYGAGTFTFVNAQLIWTNASIPVNTVDAYITITPISQLKNNLMV